MSKYTLVAKIEGETKPGDAPVTSTVFNDLTEDRVALLRRAFRNSTPVGGTLAIEVTEQR